jgi:hypothetical protein
MRWTGEEFIYHMTFGRSGTAPKREMLCECMGPLIGLDVEWKAQGASPEEINLTAFGFDYVDTVWVGNTGSIHLEKEEVIEETAEYIITKDSWGRIVKMIKGTSTIPLPIKYTVKTMDDWLKVKHRFQFEESRIDMGQIEKAKTLQQKGYLVKAGIPGGYDLPRELMGDEEACLCYYDDPELIQDILATASETSYRVLEKISRHITVDCLSVHEDMAGKGGPMIGPNLIAEFIKPYYRRAWDMLEERGAKIFMQDSDGDIRPVLSIFADAGVNLFYPCEPAAGMDIVEIRKKHGTRFAMLGGIDKHVLHQNKEAIRRELEYKFQSEMRGGGICFGLDHRIPNGTPLENYRYYVQTAQEMLGLDNSEKGWARFV